MSHSTTDTYICKRKIVNFSKKISSGLPRPQQKFVADMAYGILASGSCLLTDVADALHEDSKKINIVDRLSRHLGGGIPPEALSAYLSMVRQWAPDEPVIHIDGSDIVKPEGRKFESIARVRDGSRSTDAKTVYGSGYLVTEACVLTRGNHPASFFSRVHSPAEPGYVSSNAVTFDAMERGASLFGKATFVMDRGYDDNKMFLKLDGLGQDYVVRLKRNRKLFYRSRWVSAAELAERRKGKVKMRLVYKGKERFAYLSHIKTQLTASKRDVCLVLVYGITEQPMMLVTNRPVRSKEDVVRTARLYFSRWRIEEYFRSKKQEFGFEDFRVRTLAAINALNFCLTVCMAFLAAVQAEAETTRLKCAAIRAADPVKENVSFQYYRIARGIRRILSYAREGVRMWFKTVRPAYRQMTLPMVA